MADAQHIWQCYLAHYLTAALYLQVVLDSLPRWPLLDAISGTDWCPRQKTRILELA